MRIAKLRIPVLYYAGERRDGKLVGFGALTRNIPAGTLVFVLDEWAQEGPLHLVIQEITTGLKSSIHRADLAGLSALEALAYVDYDPFVVEPGRIG